MRACVCACVRACGWMLLASFVNLIDEIICDMCKFLYGLFDICGKTLGYHSKVQYNSYGIIGGVRYIY